ncbi:M protein, putative, partial [Eimeria tenella]
LPPDHPLLRGAQAALKQQQQQQLQQLQHALQQQKVEQQKVDRQHEETGKQLYEEQQKLKRLKARISQVAEEEKTVKQQPPQQHQQQLQQQAPSSAAAAASVATAAAATFALVALVAAAVAAAAATTIDAAAITAAAAAAAAAAGEIEEIAAGKKQLRIQLGSCMQGLERRAAAEIKIKKEIENQNNKLQNATMDTREVEETKQLLSECKKKEEELIKIEFDAAQLQLERVGLQAAAAAAAAEASAVEADIAEKENLLDQFKAEIRKGHIRISRKEMLVDQLNREYDAKRSAHGDESSGLLDGTIRQLRNKLTQNTQDIAHLQQAWVQKQTDLLNLQTKISEKKEEVAAKKDEILIRQQRSQRVAAAVSSSKKELAKLQGELRAQQQLAERVQRQLAAFKQQQQQQQQEANAAAEENRLKLQQKLAAKEALLQSIKKTEAERERSLEETLNLEREIALWEEKIKLEKEMQQAVDPNLGQVEESVATLKREIKEAEEKTKETEEKMETEKVRLLFEKGCLVQIQRLVKDLSTLTDEEIQTNLKPSIELALHKVQSEAASVASAIEETEQVCKP